MTGPYVPLVPEVAVRVTVGGEQRPGQAIGWRDDRVFVRYRRDEDGNRLGWVDGAAVERVQGTVAGP